MADDVSKGMKSKSIDECRTDLYVCGHNGERKRAWVEADRWNHGSASSDMMGTMKRAALTSRGMSLPLEL